MSYSYTQKKKKPKRLARAAEIIQKKEVDLDLIKKASNYLRYLYFAYLRNIYDKRQLTLSEYKLLKWYIQEAV